MATFEATRSQYTQTHFEVLEIDLPVITGTCTIGANDGFGTPLTCDQVWDSVTDGYQTYKFTNQNAPLLSEPVIYRCITSINENPTEVKPGNGLSARGTLTVTMSDLKNLDPNEGAAGVTDAVRAQGTLLGKLNARQIMENKAVRLKLYRVEDDGTIDLTNGAETHYYIVESFKSNDNGTWTLACKDVMSLADLNEKTWPPTTGGFLRLDIDDTVTSIPVDGVVDYSAVEVVRIGEEFFNVTSVTGNQTGSASLTVATRGLPITGATSGKVLTRTFKDDHSAGDEVFYCRVSDDEEIDDFITTVLTDSDFDVALIPAADWAAEVAEWHSTDKINTIHSESEDVNDVLQRVLTGFLMDMWFDQVDNEAKLSAISVWKQSSASLTEGKEIEAYTLKTQAVDSLRASRALVIYNKSHLAEDDSVSNYKQASIFSDNSIISEALYKEHKDKQFDNNHLIGEDAADLLTQRYVSRFKYTPLKYTWTTQERFLTFKTGDVVDLNSQSIQGFDGAPASNIRAQITKITPKYTRSGRSYSCQALGYDAAFNNNSEIVLDEPLNEANLYILAGAPSTAVTITFILDGSYSSGQTAIYAGNFPAGSKIILILVDAYDAQADGGEAGRGESIEYDAETNQWITSAAATTGGNGGTVYDANGIDTDIYLSGDTSAISAAYPVADGYIRAPGGGADGTDSPSVGTDDATGYGGNGGGGGAGREPGTGGDRGIVTRIGSHVDGEDGLSGDILGNGGLGGDSGAPVTAAEDGGDWGQDAIGGGLAGAGVIDSAGGATVTFFGSTAARYINGNGDYP